MSKNRSSKNKAADAASTGNTAVNDKVQETQESQQAPVEQVEQKDVVDTAAQGEPEQQAPVEQTGSESQSAEEPKADAPAEPDAAKEETAAEDQGTGAPQEEKTLTADELNSIATPAASEQPEVIVDSIAETNDVVIGAADADVASEPAAPEVETPAAVVAAPPAPVFQENAPAFLNVQRIRLTDYVKAMGGALRISDKEQLDQQNLFRLVVQGLLKLRGQDFVIALDDLLATIQANKHYAFKEKYVFRQYPNLPISPEERRLLVDVVTLLLHIADPATRALVINQIDLSNALKGVRDFDEVHGLFHEYITNPSR